MFNKTLSEIEFVDVDNFCKTYNEGIRVEYKRELIDKIPKAISAFANTQGGILVMGVTADDVTNKVISLDGIDAGAGIEEKIINSALDGIYPSVLPEVKIVEVPGKDNKVIIIRVHESEHAPHAIQNSTKVYIRTGSVSKPYDLSKIDRIEYLLDRRRQSNIIKNDLADVSFSRCLRLLKENPIKAPYIKVNINPMYPNKPVISLNDLFEFSRNNYGDSKRVPGGVCSLFGRKGDFTYRSLDHYGMVSTCESLIKSKAGWVSSNIEENERVYLRFTSILILIIKAIKFAYFFYEKCNYMGNLEIKVELMNIASEYLLLGENFFSDSSWCSIDNAVESFANVGPEEIKDRLLERMGVFAKDILWVFNCEADPEGLVNKVVVANGFV